MYALNLRPMRTELSSHNQPLLATRSHLAVHYNLIYLHLTQIGHTPPQAARSQHCVCLSPTH